MSTGRQRSHRAAVVGALGLLYLTQGLPFGFASEYLPVVLRGEGYSYAAIAAAGWLQLPWQLKIFWAKVADGPYARRRATSIVSGLQVALALTIAAFATCTLHTCPTLWFVLTALCATLAATQDVFVDALAVRALLPEERGLGNAAQVVGYRLGMLTGGAALLIASSAVGERTSLLACAGIVVVASLGARRLETLEGVRPARSSPATLGPDEGEGGAASSSVRGLVSHMLRRETRAVLGLALVFKLGVHMASGIAKPMLRDFGWTHAQIGWAAVTVGSASALFGAAVGGFVHRACGEKRALYISMFLHAIACAPLVFVARSHAPVAFTTAALGVEHFASGLGTTALFAALMSATRPSQAGLHYTVLTSANALAIGIGGVAGGLLADTVGLAPTFAIASLVSLLPFRLVRRWPTAAQASAGTLDV